MTPDENDQQDSPAEQGDSKDVLKRLQSIRKKLQESLSDGEEKKIAEDQEEISLVPGAAEEMAKHRRAERVKEQREQIAELDKQGTKRKKRRLYKKGEAPKAAAPKSGFGQLTAPKKFKKAKSKKKRVSARRMALIQRRVQKKVQSTKRISKKHRAAILITIGICVVPLLLTSQIAVATMNFDIDEIGFTYPGTTQGELMIFLPVYNPGIMPAFLGRLSLDIYDATVDPWVKVGTATTNEQLNIGSHESRQLSLRLNLDPATASNWLADLLNTLELRLAIRDLHYNGIKLADNLIPELPPIDVSSLLLDLLGLDMADMIADLFGSEGDEAQAQIRNAYSRALGMPTTGGTTRNLWHEYLAAVDVMNARDDLLQSMTQSVPDAADQQDSIVGSRLGSIVSEALVQSFESEGLNFPSTSTAETGGELLSLRGAQDLGDFELKNLTINDYGDRFEVTVVAGIPVPDASELIGYYIGPVVISNLSASMFVPTDSEMFGVAETMMRDDPDAFNEQDPAHWETIYGRELVRIESMWNDYVGEAHQALYGDVVSENIYPAVVNPDGISIEFGGMAKLGVNVTIFKDGLGAYTDTFTGDATLSGTGPFELEGNPISVEEVLFYDSGSETITTLNAKVGGGTPGNGEYSLTTGPSALDPAKIVGKVVTGRGLGTDDRLVVKYRVSEDDDVGEIHPSQLVDWNDPVESAAFIERAQELYPTWYFVHNLLANGGLNVYMQVRDLDATIFGLPIDDVAVTFLPPIAGSGLFDLSDLGTLGSTIGFGAFDAVSLLVQSASTGGLMFPFALDNALPGVLGSNGADSYDRRRRTLGLLGQYAPNAAQVPVGVPDSGQFDPNRDIMEQIEEMLLLDTLDVDEILNSLAETFDENAKLSLQLTIGLNNTLFDIYLGMKDTWIGLSNEIDGTERVFAKVQLSSEGSNEVFLEGALQPGDEPVPLTLTLEIYKNETMAPHCGEFIRTLIEQWLVSATFNIHMGQLLLFKEKYTWPNIDLSIAFELDVWDMLEDVIVDLVEGLFPSDEDESGAEGTSAALGQGLGALFGRTVGLPYSLALGLLTSSPVAPYMGLPVPAQDDESSGDPISDLLSDLLGVDLGGELQIEIGVNNFATSTQLFLRVAGLEVPTDEIPISVGLGYADINISTKNAFGGWDRIVNVQIENYIDLATPAPISIYLTLDIFHSPTLCTFVEGLLSGGTLNISVDGVADLNLTGIYMEDLHMSLALEELELGLDVQSLIDDLISGLDGSRYQALPAGEYPEWWSGDPDDPLFQAQLDDLDDYLELGDILINKIEERNWPHLTEDWDIEVEIAVGIRNKLMNLELKQLDAILYYQQALEDWEVVRIDAPNQSAVIGGNHPPVTRTTELPLAIDDAGGVRVGAGEWAINPNAYRLPTIPIRASGTTEEAGFLRFTPGVQQGSTINSAVLNVTPSNYVNLSLYGPVQLYVKAFLADDVSDFRTDAPANGAITASTAVLDLMAWNLSVPVSVDVSTLVQEVVNQPTFSGQHIGFVIGGWSLPQNVAFEFYARDSMGSNPGQYPLLTVNATAPTPVKVDWHVNDDVSYTRLLIAGAQYGPDFASATTEVTIPQADFSTVFGSPGPKPITVDAYDANGALIGTDSITVTYNPAVVPTMGTARPAQVPPKHPLANLTLVEGTGRLSSNTLVYPTLNIQLNKSQALEGWLNNLLSTLEISGFISANITLEVFGCTIGPLEINDLDLAALGLDSDSLMGMFDAVNMFSETHGDRSNIMHNQPNAAQTDIMDLLGKFGLGWVAINQCPYDVGPVNLETPMLDVIVGVALEPNLNLSIAGGPLQLLDKTIFDAIYDVPDDQPRDVELWNKAVTYSRVAQVEFRQNPIYCNNTYSTPWRPNNFTVNPEKPYFYNYTLEDHDDGFAQMDTFVQSWRDPGDPAPVPGFDPDLMIPLHNESNTNWVGGTFTWFEIELKIYNMSHPSFQYAYPREFWRKLGGPYFPQMVFGPDEGGFPEHRVEYHPYFSPLANFFSIVGELDLMSFDFAPLLANIALNGSVSLNIFSMDLTLDVGMPVIGDLMGGLVETLSETLLNHVEKVANPAQLLADTMMLRAAYAEQQEAASALANSEDPITGSTGPRAAQFDDLLGGEMEFNADSIYSLLDCYVISERNDHAYDGVHEWGGTNLNPFRYPGYKAGLAEYGGSNEETFYKDIWWEHYKTVTQNWANSLNEDNPIYETYNPYTGEPLPNPASWPLKWVGSPSSGKRMRSIVLYYVAGADLPFTLTVHSAFAAVYLPHSSKPCQWAPAGYLFINESKTLPQGYYPNALGAPGIVHPQHWMYLDDEDLYGWGLEDGWRGEYNWMEGHLCPNLYQNAAQRYYINHPENRTLINTADWNGDGNKQGLWEPDPWTWVHSSGYRYTWDLSQPPVGSPPTPADGAPAYTNLVGEWSQGILMDRWINGTGSTGGHYFQPSNLIDINIRLFETPQAFQFLWELLENQFNLVLNAAFMANVSLFGYELYNLGLEMPMGDEFHASDALCERYKASGGTAGQPYGTPSPDGTVPTEHQDDQEWPASLPGFESEGYGSVFGDALVGILMSTILDDLLGSITDFSNLGLSFEMSGLSLRAIYLDLQLNLRLPIALPGWLWYIEAGVLWAWNETAALDPDQEWLDKAHWENGMPAYLDWDTLTSIFVDDVMLEFDAYPDQYDGQRPGTIGDFQTDPMESITLATSDDYAAIPLQIALYMEEVGDLIGTLIGPLIDWLIDALFNGFEFDLETLPLYLLVGIYPLIIYALFPGEWGWWFNLQVVDASDLFFNVKGLLSGDDISIF